jgi:hypothetical protein
LEILKFCDQAIRKLESDSPDDAEASRLREIEAMHSADSDKHAKLRQGSEVSHVIFVAFFWWSRISEIFSSSLGRPTCISIMIFKFRLPYDRFNISMIFLLSPSKPTTVLAKKNQEIAAVLRQIDDIPTRAELIQYERRFVELYQLVCCENTLPPIHEYCN